MSLRTWGWAVPLLALMGLVGCGDDDADSALDGRAAEEGQHNGSPTQHATAGAGGSPTGDMAAPTSAGGGASVADAAFRNAGRPSGELMEPSNEGDRYENVGTNPFVMVAHDPFSTFAADVDTASYDLFRRDINLGILPSPDSVRLEEYVNNFDYDYPAPDREGAAPFSISLAAASDALGRDTTLLRVGIQGKPRAEFEKRPTNLVFLIDTSGSMQSEEKLPLVQQMLTLTLDFLDPQDTVSIVTYAGDTRVALAPTEVANKGDIAEVINSFAAGGSTAGASGIQLAYEQADAGFLQDGINHVVLCTDGDFNVGPSSDEALLALIEDKRRTGITLTALGFGIGNLNDSMMEKVSNAGNGIYSVISSAVHAERYVSENMLSTLEHIAKDVKIQVEFNPDHVQAYRLLGYENRAIADDEFRDDTVDAGEIGAGHTVTALYELVLANEAVPEVEGAPEIDDGDAVDGDREIAGDDLVLLKVRYKAPGAGETDPAEELQASMAPGDVHTGLPEADDDLAWAIAMAGLAEILKQSPYGNAEQLDAIDAIIRPQAGRDADRTEMVALFDQLMAMLPGE